MINLSSRMTGMELMSNQARRGKKRVRFSLPEGDMVANCIKTIEYRQREKGEFLRAKRRVTKYDNKIANGRESELLAEATDPEDNVDTKGDFRFDVHVDNIISFKRRRQDTCDNDNVNTNCAIKGDTPTQAKGVNKRPSTCISNECLTPKKICKVVNTSYKDDSDVKYMLNDNLKVADILTDVKTLEGKCVKQNKPAKKHIKRKNSTSSKDRHKTLPKKAKPKCQAKPKSMLKSKVKKASDKLKKSKDAKRKKLLKKASLQCKKAMSHKEKLKRKLAQKRKLNKKKAIKKKKEIKITPIEREEEVSECLRINLLKFMTFETAYEHKYECCPRRCWDEWKDLDIDDVIADFD